MVIPAFIWLCLETYLLFSSWDSVVKESRIIVASIYAMSLLGVIGLFLSAFISSKNSSFERVLEIFRKHSYLFVAATFWVFLFLGAREIAREYVRFLAFNITNSFAFPNCSGCHKFNWDTNLQLATYTTYTLFMLAFFVGLVKLYRSSSPIYIKRSVLLVYILAFPTYTSWGVHSVCGGLMGCGVGYYVDIVAPIVLSTQPLFMLLSASLAYFFVWLYSRIAKVKL